MDTPEVSLSAAAVVALKPFATAKSRLSLPAALRRRLAWTMAVDTLAALGGAVGAVLVVSSQPALAARLRRAGLDVEVAGEPGLTGMNAALTLGSQTLRERGRTTVLACVGDLPALRAISVRRILAVAQARPGHGFVADTTGTGTTMLVAHDVPLEPHFQGRSAAAHRAAGAVALTPEVLGGAFADARQDVDTEIDLLAASTLGLGASTSALIDPETGRLARYCVVTATSHRDAADEQLAVTASGHRVLLPAGSLSDGLRHARTGQRLHAVLSGERVLSAWL